MTLTPSRAATIFKTEGEHPGQEHQREALPWWFFGVVGGLLTVWFGKKLLAGHLGFPAAADGEDGSDVSKWLSWSISAASFAVCFAPGAIIGGIVGWFIIRPVNGLLAWVFRGFNRLFDRATALYGWTIGKLLRLSAIVVVVYGGLLFLTYWGMVRAPTGFIPVQDQGSLLVNVQLPDSASVQRTQEVLMQVDRIAREVEGVAHTVSVAGQSILFGMNGSNLGTMFVPLAPFAERRGHHDQYDEAIARKLQQRCYKEIEDAQVGVFRQPPIRGLGNAGGFKLQTEQRGFVDLNDLQSVTDELIRAANADQRFAGVFTVFRANTPQLYLDIDRTKVELLVPIQDVFTTLQVYMGGLYVNDFNKFGRTWQVRVQADAPFRTDTREIKGLKVRNRNGEMVPLGALTSVDNVGGPSVVMRYNMYTSAPVNGTPAPGVSSGEALQAMQQLAGKIDVPFEWTEISYLQILAGNVALLIFGLGTVLVYLVLAAKYESWRLPFAVILVVPMCLLAAVAGMTIARLPVDIFVQIGFLVLVGLAAKNAILIVEFARQLQHEGKSLREATLEASRLRFRPILMTSLAFIFGVVPLVLAEGAGAEMRQSLGTAVFSGMIGVTLFGILLTPVFYYVLMWFTSRKSTATEPVPHLVAGEKRG
jgi:multidrug efflux pump